VIVASDGVDLHVEVHGEGDPVLLLHGWPDSGDLWRDQVPRLASAGFRLIVPDLRGFGRSARPEGRDSYQLGRSVADMAAVLDAVGAPSAHVVGHDFGAALAWLIAMRLPGRVRTLTALSVPHPGTPEGMRQLEMAWYRLFFQFEGIAEATLEYDDWAALRALTPGYRDIDRAIANFSRPGALTASLNWYRANTAPRMPGPPRPLPPVSCPVLGVWSDGDRYLDGARMRASGELVSGPWRYAEITGASHWIPLDAPDELAALLLEWLGRPDQAVASGDSQPALRSRPWRYQETMRGPASRGTTGPSRTTRAAGRRSTRSWPGPWPGTR
jgi:pimeloyl-ACP methyl ester carboxylesterase